MIIAGIDPGTKKTGLAVMQAGELIYHGKLEYPDTTKDTLPNKLRTVYSDMVMFLRKYSPRAVIIEDQYVQRLTKSILHLSQFVGVIKLAVLHYGVEYIEVSPTAVKMLTVGDGGASKDDVRNWVNITFGIDLEKSDNDISDAIAIASTWEEAQ